MKLSKMNLQEEREFQKKVVKYRDMFRKEISDEGGKFDGLKLFNPETAAYILIDRMYRSMRQGNPITLNEELTMDSIDCFIAHAIKGGDDSEYIEGNKILWGYVFDENTEGGGEVFGSFSAMIFNIQMLLGSDEMKRRGLKTLVEDDDNFSSKWDSSIAAEAMEDCRKIFSDLDNMPRLKELAFTKEDWKNKFREAFKMLKA